MAKAERRAYQRVTTCPDTSGETTEETIRSNPGGHEKKPTTGAPESPIRDTNNEIRDTNPDTPPLRPCSACCFARTIGGRLHCCRNAPTVGRAGRARWPIVHPTDTCGLFSHELPNHHSSLIIHPCHVHTDQFGAYCKIPLTQGRYAKVDPADYLWLSQFRWHCKVNDDTIYAVRCITVEGRSKRVYMHRLIMNTPPHLVCDHMNHQGLDNRRNNLRNCTKSQNNANRRSSPDATSQFVGVSWDARRQIWVAHIKKNGHPKYLGGFPIEQDAARAYDAAARVLHAEFANLNFPEEANHRDTEVEDPPRRDTEKSDSDTD